MTHTDRVIGICIILGSTCFEAGGQFAFKRAADFVAPPEMSFFWRWFCKLRWIAAGWLSFIVEGLLWSAALYYLDLSVAHPIGSLVFVVVAILSRVFLKEKVSARRWFGISLILAGTILVATN